MTKATRYTHHLDVLMALITYLALTHQQSRTPPSLAGDLALEADDVAATFAAFPGSSAKARKLTPMASTTTRCTPGTRCVRQRRMGMTLKSVRKF